MYLYALILLFATYLIMKIYLKLSTGWCRSQTCLVNKTAIITGANTGIGYETALDFAKRGARVILACRNVKKAEEAKEKIIEETGNKNIVVKVIDMASFDSVRNFAKEIYKSEDRLDILVNNAGAMALGKKTTVDGHSLVMQVNYFSAFLLTHLLIDLLKKSSPSRIINVSSLGAAFAVYFDVNKIDQYQSDRDDYFNSKLCNILFTKELAIRLEGTGVTTYSLHPGIVKTDIFNNIKGIWHTINTTGVNLVSKNIEEGAQTTIYCSVAKGIEKYNGAHFSDCKRTCTYWTATNPELGKKLWKISEEIVQLKSDKVLL